MRVEITGRNIDITPAIRDFTEDKLGKLERWLDEIIETHVVLSVEKHRHIAEIVVHGRNRTLTGTDATGDLYASIGNAVDKLEAQARRLKDKWSGRRKHARPAPRASLRPVVPKSSNGNHAGSVDASPRIIRMPLASKKPLSVEDAALALLESDREFLVFRDARSLQIHVIYRRRDGHLGLIEPER
ncbi:MAG: ribosome hibernation-promoting factor, HPF/YfiA family [Acidobacteriota bacterium]